MTDKRIHILYVHCIVMEHCFLLLRKQSSREIDRKLLSYYRIGIGNWWHQCHRVGCNWILLLERVIHHLQSVIHWEESIPMLLSCYSTTFQRLRNSFLRTLLHSNLGSNPGHRSDRKHLCQVCKKVTRKCIRKLHQFCNEKWEKLRILLPFFCWPKTI